jgi:hypothetical protein
LQRDDRGQAVFVVGGADDAGGLDRQQAAAAGDDVAAGVFGDLKVFEDDAAGAGDVG